jgi:hypothetical protein
VNRYWSCILLLLAALSAPQALAEQPDPDGIVFLHLTLVGDAVQLDKVKVAEGTLKTPRTVSRLKDRIYVEVLDGDDRRLHEAVIRDPSHVVYEWADDDGQLHSKLVVKDSVTFVVRIPLHDALHRVRFSRILDATGGAAPRAVPDQSLGSVTVDLGGEDDEK